MITSQRIIIYRSETNQDESDYEIVNSFDFSSIGSISVVGEYFLLLEYIYLTSCFEMAKQKRYKTRRN